MRLHCSECHRELDLPSHACACGGLAEFTLGNLRIDAQGYRRLLRERRAGDEPAFASGVWRLRELLPPIAPQAVVTLAEGNVPLYDSPRGGAYAEGHEDRKGTLREGMLADFTCFDQDLFDLSPAEILSSQVVLTVVDGEVVYRTR